MHEINHRDPASMTQEERLSEVASLLARGLARLWEPSVAKSANVVAKSEFRLGYSANQRVHTNPFNNVTEF